MGLPSLSTIQPVGTCSPRLRARLILPAATALVAMSSKTCPGRLLGTPMQMGLVPRRRAATTKGRHGLGAGSGVGGEDGDHPLFGANAGIVAQASDMALAADGEGRDTGLLGFVDSHARGLLSDDETKPPVAVHHRGGRRLAEHLKGARREQCGPGRCARSTRGRV